MARFNKLEKELLKRLLDEAIDALSNNGCNDLPVEVINDNKAQVRRLIRATEAGDDETTADMLDDAKPGHTVYLTDFAVLQHFRDRLLGE
jgi:hypothetical protein